MGKSSMQNGSEVRQACRNGELTGQTAGLAPGAIQANLVVLPDEHALDFLAFCQLNRRSCPVLEVCTAGNFAPSWLARDCDLRTDLPRYRVWRNGELQSEPTDIRELWRDDLVSILLGCSFSFESALIHSGIPIRHQSEGKRVPLYNTRIACHPVRSRSFGGEVAGHVVVSMRPMTPSQAIESVKITAQYPRVHGAPIHIGDPEAIGIANIGAPDFGDAVTIHPDEIPVFWACGVTSQNVLQRAALPFVITHSPGSMLVTDQTDESLIYWR